jgi:ribokinase
MRVPRAPAAGETIVGGPFEMLAGGKGSNQAIAAARLGAEVHLLTALGRDSFAQQARLLWRAEGVDAEQVVEVDAATMVGIVLVEDSGQNRIAIAPGALDEVSPAVVESFRHEIAVADVLLVQLEIPPPAAARALRLAREAGVTTVFNPAPARRLEPETLALADFLTPNRAEAETLTGLSGSEQDLAAALIERGARRVVLTLGEQGALIVSAEEVVRVPAARVDCVVDTTGAGDAFNAAFAVALAEGRDPVEATRWGCAAGAASVVRWGVVPSLPYREELTRIVTGPTQQAWPYFRDSL